MSIGSKLVVICLIMSLVPLGITGFLSYKKAQKALLTSLDQILLARAQDTVRGINDWIMMMKNDVKEMALTPPGLGTDEAMNHYLQQEIKNTSNYETIFTVNTEGVINHHSNDKGIGMLVKNRSYFQEAINNKSFISDVIISELTGKPVFYISTPIKDDMDRITGVFVASVSLDKMTQDILGIKIGANGYAYVIDKKGIFIVHPIEEIVLNEAENAFVTDNDHSRQITQDMIDGKTGNDIDFYKGIEKHLGYAPIETTGWSIGVTAPNNDSIFFKDMKQLRHFLFIVMMIAATLVVIVAVGFARYLAHYLVIPIKELTRVAEVMSQGDLKANVQATTNDEVGQLAQAFNKMVGNTRQLISGVATVAENLGASSQQMAACAQESSSMSEQMTQTVEELAKGATEQATSIEQTTENMHQMATITQDVFRNAEIANEAGKHAGEASLKGKHAVEQAIQTMTDVQKVVNESVASTQALGENSKEISKIVGLITGIADQTNLLALNAAIEAARAGEQGRGFAVVADEVRKLAEESSHAAGQIAQLIKEVQHGTSKTVDLMSRGAKVVEEGWGAVQETGKRFDDIHQEINQIAMVTEKVSVALQQMSAGVEEVVETMDNISNITEQSASGTQQAASATQEQMASIEEIASSAQHVAQMAEELQRQVRQFTI